MNETQIQKRLSTLGKAILIPSILFTMYITFLFIATSISLSNSMKRNANIPGNPNRLGNFEEIYIFGLVIFSILIFIFFLFSIAGSKLSKGKNIDSLSKGLKALNIAWIILIVLSIVPSFLLFFVTIKIY